MNLSVKVCLRRVRRRSNILGVSGRHFPSTGGFRMVSTAAETAGSEDSGPIRVKFSMKDLNLPVKKPEDSVAKAEDLRRNELLEKLPPSLKLVRKTMDSYKDCVVLTQIGSFYELYFEHAVEYSKMLNITLSRRKTTHVDVPMAGFPINNLQKYLKILVQENGKGVVLTDQFKADLVAENDPNRISRRVTRIISPGTLIDEEFMNPQKNNYLLYISFPDTSSKKRTLSTAPVALAWIDISVGTTFIQTTTLENTMSAVSSINPNEIILDSSLLDLNITNGEWFAELAELKKYVVKYQDVALLPIQNFKQNFDCNEFEWNNSINEISNKENGALRRLLLYVQYHLPEMKLNLQLPTKVVASEVMQIDSRTAQALELHKSFRNESVVGSLIRSVNRTATSSGARLLENWISSPSTSIEEIKKRQDLTVL